MDLTMMERVGDRWEKKEGSCSTGRSPQWAVVPVEEVVSLSSGERDKSTTLLRNVGNFTRRHGVHTRERNTHVSSKMSHLLSVPCQEQELCLNDKT
jgi:hypothetical protein